MSKNRPTIDEAVEMVRALHYSATHDPKLRKHIKNPVAWALYKAWEVADRTPHIPTEIINSVLGEDE